ncbi:helix-turn-helix domain-containing protein [Nocardia huaxiensis]|uniref:Helix-turn-helix domain-containing protein n=1 Tax=Nocardia huaxiensis TaxID=2755382 RepID=A0A7D6Z3C7_9NOCA|nr:helix-turn-helix transcriptional regulator [Nocardia huaxiensis]QLY31866.1 helix-turn-helix domain-containing protein [Nocardia huaxiensis]UFS95431.1 helix-turn-helix domain-containing protein [Nocardia huaxiensis]
MTEVLRARAALGARLRELRKDARLDAVQLSVAAGWHKSKTSRIELGRQTPSEADLETWCAICDARLALPDLLASLRNVQAQWSEWKRIAAAGHTRRQRRQVDLESRATLQRTYAPVVLPGLLQTESYARAVLSQCIRFLGTPDDLGEALAARMERHKVLQQPRHRFNLLADESALYTTVGNSDVMVDQLQYLLDSAFDIPRMLFGIVPRDAEFTYMTTSFDLFDDRLALIETVSAEITVVTSAELALYERIWKALQAQAVYGKAARALISTALESRLGG